MAISDNNPQYKYVAAGKTVLADQIGRASCRERV